MKKKILKIIAVTVSVALVLVTLVFANAFFGNPVSKALAKSTAQKHLAEAYSDTDYYIEKVGYNFKFSDYYALIKSPSSTDTVFNLYISPIGKLGYDTFDNVTNKFTTAQRLETEYRALTDKILTGEKFPFSSDIAFGTLEIYPKEDIESGNDDIPVYAINQSELVLDKIYDINELGKRAGTLVIYVDSDTVTAEKAAEVMLAVKDIFDAEGVYFAAMDFTLQYPRPEDGVRPEGEVSVADFLYEDIKKDNMTERVIEADKALREYYEKLDKENEALITQVSQEE